MACIGGMRDLQCAACVACIVSDLQCTACVACIVSGFWLTRYVVLPSDDSFPIVLIVTVAQRSGL